MWSLFWAAHQVNTRVRTPHTHTHTTHTHTHHTHTPHIHHTPHTHHTHTHTTHTYTTHHTHTTHTHHTHTHTHTHTTTIVSCVPALVSHCLPLAPPPFCPNPIQRFFKYLCIAAKVKESIALAKKAQREGKVCACVECLSGPIPAHKCRALLYIQWDISIVDTIWTQLAVLYREVSLIQR